MFAYLLVAPGGSGRICLHCRTGRRPIAVSPQRFLLSALAHSAPSATAIYHPMSNLARMLAVMEAITGTLYVAVLISRLVALYSSEQLQLGARKH